MFEKKKKKTTITSVTFFDGFVAKKATIIVVAFFSGYVVKKVMAIMLLPSSMVVVM
jgi:hypothetical protein